MQSMRLITKMTLLMGIITTTLVLVASAAILGITYTLAESKIKTELAQDATTIITELLTVRDNKIDTVAQDGGSQLAESLREKNLSLIIVDKNNTEIAHYGIYRNLDAEEKKEFLPESLREMALYRDITSLRHGTYDTYTSPLIQNRESVGYIQISRSNTLAPLLYSATTKSLFIIVPLLLFVTLISSRYATTLLLTPLEKLSHHLNSIDTNHIPKSLTVTRGLSPEITTIITTFNALIVRLTAKTQEEHEMLENISHEIKTPLTRISSTMQAMLPTLTHKSRLPIRSLIDETLHVGRIVDTLLELSQDSFSPAHVEPYSLRAVVTKIVRDLGAEHKTSIEIDDVMISTHPLMTQMLIRNILANAVDHSHPHSVVHIVCHSFVITIQNTVAHTIRRTTIGQRGVKSVTSNGYGLGLSIIQLIAKKLNIPLTIAHPTKSTMAISLTLR